MEASLPGVFGTTFGTTMDWKKSIRVQALALFATTLAACGGGSSGGGGGATVVTVAGQLFYESPTVLASPTSCLYDFDNPVIRPVRRAPVELRDASGALVSSATTDDTGAYRFSNVAANTNVTLRVRSQIVQSGAQSWAVYVRDNTEPGFALTNKPVYVVEFGPFSTGSGSTSRDFVAATGWGVNSYTDTRAAAPLAILDALLDGYLLVASADADFDMGRLDAFWSPDNSITGDNDLDAGRLVTAFYSSNPDGDATRNPSLFLPGDAVGRFPGESAIDTDEFDRSVIQHEWGHFFEDELARSDSIGGTHRIPGEIEPRVAFGEGWGYGIAAVANTFAGDANGARLCDIGSPTGSSFPLDIEAPSGLIRGTPGFFNEVSIASLLYDLYDPANENTTDDGELGFGPIYDTMIGPQSSTPAFTTLFSFATELGASLDQTDLDFLARLLNRENVDTAALDIWGSGQATLPVDWRDVLPVYTDLPTDGSVLRLCANNDLDPFQDGNKPGEWRYLRFTTNSTSRWRVFAEADPVPPPAPPSDPAGAVDVSDPDLWMFRNGDLINICPGIDCRDTGSGVSADPNSETMDTALLDAGTYVIAFNEYVYGVENIASNFPDRMCFNITANPR